MSLNSHAVLISKFHHFAITKSFSKIPNEQLKENKKAKQKPVNDNRRNQATITQTQLKIKFTKIK